MSLPLTKGHCCATVTKIFAIAGLDIEAICSQISLAFSVASALFLSPRGWYPPPPAFCSACRICSVPLWPNSLIFNSLQPLCVLLASPALCFLSVTASFRKTPGWGGHISRRWFGGEEQEESQPLNQAPVRPR